MSQVGSNVEAPVDESSPLNKSPQRSYSGGSNAGGQGSQGGCPAFMTCSVSTMFCGCAGLGVGTMIIMGLDFLAFILLIVSGAIWLIEGGCLALANGVFFIIAAILLAIAVFIKERDWSNVMVWSSLFFHCLLVILTFAGWIWQVVNLAKCGDYYPEAGGFRDSRHGDCIASSTIGFLTQLVYFFLLFHFIQVINSWRVRNMGGRPLGQIFNIGSSAANAPKS